MRMANQIQMTRRFIQERCSNQPIGLRYNSHFNQRFKVPVKKMGVKNCRCSATMVADGGASRAARFTLRAAMATRSNSNATEQIGNARVAEAVGATNGAAMAIPFLTNMVVATPALST